MQSRHLSRVIHAEPSVVYDFAVNPDNLRLWAHGLAESDIQRNGDDLVISSPMGNVRVRFAPRNAYGVLDHDVVLPTGATVNNPMRVIAHPEGTEVIFTVRQLELSDEEFERDCHVVSEDLARLTSILER